MNILVLCLSNILLAALVEYKFWLNYGELFYDYSGNSHHGRNGPSEYDTTKNVYYTDRGAYFNSQSVIYAVGYTYYPDPSTVLIWMNANTSDGKVYTRWDPNFCMHVWKTSGKIDILYNDNEVIFQVVGSSNSWASNTWNLLSIEQSSTTLNIRFNSILKKTFTVSSATPAHTSYAVTFLGTDVDFYISFTGFMWYFAVVNGANIYSSYYTTSATSCYLGSCSCSISFASPNDGNFCIYNSFDLTKDSRLNTCSSGYCRSNFVLSCKCPTLSCSILSDTNCKCIDISTGSASSTVCSCTGGGQGCCMNQCSSCIIETACLSCKAFNSYIDSVNDCSCSIGFYGDKPLISTSSCASCMIECFECTTSISCTSCKDSNSFLSNGRCKCKDSYFGPYPLGSSTCTSCLQECSKCSDGSSCDSCIDSYAIIINGRCVCKDGFYSLSSSTCFKCLPECLRCIDGISCSECINSNSSLILGRCKCNTSFYEISTAVAFSCNPCLPECLQCTDGVSCSECRDAKSSLISGRCKCDSGFYELSTTLTFSCNPCLPECLKCTDEVSCSECIDANSSLISGRCKCKTAFYELSTTFTFSCNPCLSECLQCTDGTSCIECIDTNSSLILGRCICNPGFYEESVNLIPNCKPCLPGCSKCTDGISCFVCIDANSSFILGRCKCNPGFYDESNSLTPKCNLCLPECLKCIDGVSCSECNDPNSSLILGRCKCNPGFYEISTTFTFSCSPCLSECYTCSNSSSCDICKDPTKDSTSEDFSCTGLCNSNCSLSNNTICTDSNCKNCTLEYPEICNKCEDNFLNNNGQCISCENLNKTISCLNCYDICNQCSKTQICEECLNKKLGENDCFCKNGFKNDKGTCVQSYFDVYLTINQLNQLFLQFSENLLEDLSTSDFILKQSNVTLSKKVLKLNQSSYKVLIKFPSSNSNLASKSNLLVIFNQKIASVSYSTLIKTTYTLILFDNYENDMESKLKSIKKFTSRGNSILVGITISASFFTFDFSSFFNFLNVVELVSIIFLFELDIPLETKELLKNLRVQKSIPNGLENFVKDTKDRKIDETFAEYGYGYEVFILNSGNALITQASVTFLVLVHKTCLSRFIMKFPRLLSIHQYLEYNILLKTWIQTTLELLITTTYGIKLFTDNEPWYTFDFSLCIIIFISQILTFSISFILCIKRSKIENEEEKKKFESKFNVLLNELKENNFPLFYFIFFIRRFLLVMIVNFIPIPIIKLVFSAILSFALALYVLFTFCFKEKVRNLENIFNEVFCFSLHLIILMMSLDSMKEKENLKSAALYNVLAIWITNSVFSVTKFALKIAEFVRSKLKKSRVEPEIKKDIMISNLET